MHGQVKGASNLSGGIRTGTAATRALEGWTSLAHGQGRMVAGDLFVVEGLVADSRNLDSCTS